MKTPHPLFKEREKLENYLKEQGLKVSQGRTEVFHEVMNSHGHFTAEDLLKHFRSGRKKISRATIYRTIKELLEARVIRKTAFGEKHEHYEHVYDEKLHHHARCIRCYELIEFPCFECDARYVHILKDKKFQILGHEMHFYGLCSKCQKKKD